MEEAQRDPARLPRLREIGLRDLEGPLAIFPLPGALLLPRGRLPLNIFEPRYVAMIEDALRDRRLIGMIQPRGGSASYDDDDDEEDDSGAGSFAEGFAAQAGGAADPAGQGFFASPLEPPPLYEVGCAGRLLSFLEREDGTYAITLAGVARFRVRAELDLRRGYRRVTPDFGPYALDLLDPGPVAFERTALLAALRRFFELRGFEARWEAIEQMDDETLIVTLSMICPFQVPEKQALLEAPSLAQRARTLLALLQMAGHESGGHSGHNA